VGKAVIVSEQGEGLYTVKKEVTGLAAAQALAAARRAKLEEELPPLRAEEEEAVIAVAYQFFITNQLIDDWVAGIDIPEQSLKFNFSYEMTEETQEYIRTAVEGKVTGFEVPEAVLNAIHELWDERGKLEAIRAQLYAKQAEYLALLKWQSELTALENSAKTPIPAWCADYTEGLTGTVATLEVPGEVDPTLGGGINIKPGYDDGSIWGAAYGQIQFGKVLSPAGFAWNLTMLQPWLKWMPLWRYATVLAVDESADTVDVELLPILSKARVWLRKDLTINTPWESSMSGVPVRYMSCGAAVFEAGDEVIVQFDLEDLEGSPGLQTYQPYVIGFYEEPRQCEGGRFGFLPASDAAPSGWYVPAPDAPREPYTGNFILASTTDFKRWAWADISSFIRDVNDIPGNQHSVAPNGDVLSWWGSPRGDGPISYLPDGNIQWLYNEANKLTPYIKVINNLSYLTYFSPDTQDEKFIPGILYKNNVPLLNYTTSQRIGGARQLANGDIVFALTSTNNFTSLYRRTGTSTVFLGTPPSVGIVTNVWRWDFNESGTAVSTIIRTNDGVLHVYTVPLTKNNQGQVSGFSTPQITSHRVVEEIITTSQGRNWPADVIQEGRWDEVGAGWSMYASRWVNKSYTTKVISGDGRLPVALRYLGDELKIAWITPTVSGTESNFTELNYSSPYYDVLTNGSPTKSFKSVFDTRTGGTSTRTISRDRKISYLLQIGNKSWNFEYSDPTNSVSIDAHAGDEEGKIEINRSMNSGSGNNFQRMWILMLFLQNDMLFSWQHNRTFEEIIEAERSEDVTTGTRTRNDLTTQSIVHQNSPVRSLITQQVNSVQDYSFGNFRFGVGNNPSEPESTLEELNFMVIFFEHEALMGHGVGGCYDDRASSGYLANIVAPAVTSGPETASRQSWMFGTVGTAKLSAGITGDNPTLIPIGIRK
jgi:hypothetical protein